MTKWMHKIVFCLAKQNGITEFIVHTHVFSSNHQLSQRKRKKKNPNSWPASDGFRVTVIFLQIQLGALDLKETDNCTTHFMWQPCTSLARPPACKHNHCHSVNGILVSCGDALGDQWCSLNEPDGSDVTEVMDVSAAGLCVFFFLQVNMFTSPDRQGPRREETVGEACPFQSTLCPEQN